MGNKFLILCRFTSSYFSIWEKSIRCSVEENGYKIWFYTSSPVRFEELTSCVFPLVYLFVKLLIVWNIYMHSYCHSPPECRGYSLNPVQMQASVKMGTCLQRCCSSNWSANAHESSSRMPHASVQCQYQPSIWNAYTVKGTVPFHTVSVTAQLTIIPV